jgi:hypothetical protein
MDERTGLKRKVDAYLKTLGPSVMFEKRSPGFVDHRGIADYTGCAWGYFFAIEIKHPVRETKPNAAQLQYAERVREAQGGYCVAHSVTEVMRFMAWIMEVRDYEQSRVR